MRVEQDATRVGCTTGWWKWYQQFGGTTNSVFVYDTKEPEEWRNTRQRTVAKLRIVRLTLEWKRSITAPWVQTSCSGEVLPLEVQDYLLANPYRTIFCWLEESCR